MKNKELLEFEDRRKIIKKIIVWLCVIFISIMLVLLLIVQPRFYTFLD